MIRLLVKEGVGVVDFLSLTAHLDPAPAVHPETLLLAIGRRILRSNLLHFRFVLHLIKK
jgi:hypothetical protein